MRTTYEKSFAVAAPGVVEFGAGQPGALIETLSNGEPGALEQWTIPVPASPADDTVYSYTINGTTTISINSGTGASQTTVCDALFNAHRSNPVANALGDISKNGVTELLFTAKTFLDTRLLTSSILVPALTTQAAVPASIPYGVGVTSVAGSEYKAKRPDGAGQPIIAIVSADISQERLGIGQGAVAEIPFDRDFDAVSRTGGANGIWVRVIETDIVKGDSIYCSYAAATKGFFSKNATDAEDQSAIASFQSGSKIVNNQYVIAKIRFNKP